jgi:hypothetical protein
MTRCFDRERINETQEWLRPTRPVYFAKASSAKEVAFRPKAKTWGPQGPAAGHPPSLRFGATRGYGEPSARPPQQNLVHGRRALRAAAAGPALRLVRQTRATRGVREPATDGSHVWLNAGGRHGVSGQAGNAHLARWNGLSAIARRATARPGATDERYSASHRSTDNRAGFRPWLSGRRAGR